MFELLVGEAVRKMEPTDKIPWPCGATINVSPSRIDGPDIERIVVKRDGVVIEPIRNDLVPTPLTTKLGVTRILHSGSVCYRPSTFEPGAEVIVTAIPVTGTNIVKTLEQGTLRMAF
jgi:hypothetical protein